MLIFNKKKAICDFFDKHNVFLYWYLEKYSGLSEKSYYLFLQYMVECLRQDIDELIRLDKQEQRKWIIKQIDDFNNKKLQ